MDRRKSKKTKEKGEKGKKGEKGEKLKKKEKKSKETKKQSKKTKREIKIKVTTEFYNEFYDTSDEDEDNNTDTCVKLDDSNFEKFIDNIININDIVIRDKSISLLIETYLTNPAEIILKNINGFSLRDLLNAIRENYIRIFEEERQTSTLPEESISKRQQRLNPNNKNFLINRAETNGKYGIWGHDFSDLFLEGIFYDSKKKQVTLNIGS